MGSEQMGIYEQAAMVAHEANRAYCESIGDHSQPSWKDAPEWQKESARKGVTDIALGKIQSPRQSHESWFQHKLKEGWTYGPVKDPEKKEHPCMVGYDQLPWQQQRKDTIYFAVVKAVFNLI
jgi:hypothetical protein